MHSKLYIIVDNVIARNGCNPVPTVENVSSKCVKSVYAATEGSFPYILYEVAGMGHESDTNATEDGNSAKTMWNFMSQYRLDDECDATLKWRPNIEQEGFDPVSHGWVVNRRKDIASFGREQYTTENKNIYHSLQLTKDQYQLRFHAVATGEQTVTVKLQKLTGDKGVVLDDTLTVNNEADVALDFATTDEWAEYHIEFKRPDNNTVIDLSKIEIHTSDADGITPTYPVATQAQHIGVYDLNGHRVSPDSKGVLIVNGKKQLRR